MIIKDKQCDYCGKVFAPLRRDARFCSAVCKTNSARGKTPSEAAKDLLEKPVKLGLPPLSEVDRTRAFNDEEMELVRQLPRELWLAYMDRPNSAKEMSKEDRLRHYVSKNYPVSEYLKAGEMSSRWGAH